MQRRIQGVLAWLRLVLVADLQEAVTRLQRDIDQLQHALHDPAVVKPLVLEALRQEAMAPSSEVAAALVPAVHDLLRRNLAAVTPRARRRGRACIVAATAGLAVSLVMPRGAGVSEATAESPVVAVNHQPAAVILEERNDGFGLGDAQFTDDELARQVRSRLSACKELVDARVSFSVKDGWVWLRGDASSTGRRAADEALRDLRPGAVLVNQLAVNSSGETLAER